MAQKVVICGAGFLGTYITRALVTNKTFGSKRIIQLTSRQRPDNLLFKLQPELGESQLLAAAADVRKRETLDQAFDGASVVVSLVGIMHGSPTDFEDIQWRGAENVATSAKKQGAKVVHISAIGADESSKIPYARTKALGEKAVREICPDSTIIRPSIIFGPGDGFFARFATLSKFLPFMPVFGGGQTKFQPVYVGDVARAVEIASRVDDPEALSSTNGKVFEAGGPEIFTYEEVMKLVLKYTGRKRPIISVPYGVGRMQGMLLEKLPPNLFTLTRDQVEQLKIDNIVNTSPPADHASFPKLLEKFEGDSLKGVNEILPKYLH